MISGIIRPGESAASAVATVSELAAWRWLRAELGDEPWHVDDVIAVCERERKRPRDAIHAGWAETIMWKVGQG